MKIFIPKNIEEAIPSAPDGSVIQGTISSEHGVATVTDILLHTPGVSEPSALDATRQTLTVLGQTEKSCPFRIDRKGSVKWTDQSGAVVTVESYETDQFFKRTPFDPAILDHLREKRVLIIGTGSVGAPMALELAKAGVGEIIAVDKDILEIHNCMRHVLGRSYVGWPKPVALAHYLKEQAPVSKCTPVYGDIFQGDREPLRRLIEEKRPTHILAATDSLHIQYLCQLTALHYQIPLMAVWCDNNAVEGEIFMWEPGQAGGWHPGRPERGCYACMRDPEKISVTRSAGFDYSSDDPDSYGGEPALGTFINRINNIASIFMTAWMLRDCPVQGKLSAILDEPYDGKGLQYIRLGGPYPFEAQGQVTAKTPWAVEWYRVLKRQECTFCGKSAEEIGKTLFPEEVTDATTEDCWDDFEETGTGGTQ